MGVAGLLVAIVTASALLALWSYLRWPGAAPSKLGDAIFLASRPHSGGLAQVANYPTSVSLTLPNLADGDYTVLVLTDAADAVFEGNEANNLTPAAGKLHVTEAVWGRLRERSRWSRVARRALA